MSFNEVSEFRATLGEISRQHPKLIIAGHRSLLWAIISQANGCFVGEKELADQAGLNITTTRKYLGDLFRLKLITKEQTFARKGLRQCYWVSLTGLTSLLSLSPEIALALKHTKANSLLPIAGELVPTADSANDYRPGYPYKEYKNYKNDKESFNGINELRFNKLLSYIPKDFHKFIKPGKNYEKKLDELERRGTTLEAVGGFLKSQSWDTSSDKGGLLSHFLDVLVGDSRLGVGNSKTSWCGECDVSTRTFQEASENNGKDDYRCPACNDQLLNERKRFKAREAQAKDLQELTATMFKGPSDI